jgi:hypothetical protein
MLNTKEDSTLPNSTLGDIIYAINYSVNHVNENPREPTDKDFSENSCRMKYSLHRPYGEYQRVYSVWDYSPYVFDKIRQLKGVSKDFLESFITPIDKDEEMTKSTARSGSYFYRTKDEKYYIKTLQYPEVSALITILSDYLTHLTEYPKSLLVKIYGLWRIKDEERDDLWVIVMGNAFPPGIKLDSVYDLKGRKAKPSCRRTMEKDSEIKTEYDYPKIFLIEEDKDYYLTQLKVDIELLRKHNRMDYSLLVGICQDVKEDTIIGTPQCTNQLLLRGTLAQSSEYMQYFWIHIIDILTVYNTQKKLANLFKKTVFERETLSTVDPVFYFDRFFSFMSRTLLSEEPDQLE